MTGAGFVVLAARRGAGPRDGRYEYRVWPRQPHPALSRLQRTWPLVAAERRSDIYLLPTAPGRALVKLRDGERLEIKRRTHDVGTIQHWEMPVSARFPLRRRRSPRRPCGNRGCFSIGATAAPRSPAPPLAAGPA